MKRSLCLLCFIIILMAPLVSFSESQDIAHEIWQAMGKAGNMDMSKAWEVMGVFSFGETTADGEVTLFLTDDNSKISKSVSWRNYPDDDSAVTDQFFPMLKCLLLKLDQNESDEVVDAWIMNQCPIVLLARQNNLFYRSENKQFRDMIVYVQFDNQYQELYCLITCTKSNEWFSLE